MNYLIPRSILLITTFILSVCQDERDDYQMEIPALGRIASLGDFYDIRTNQFINSTSLFIKPLPNDLIESVGNAYTSFFDQTFDDSLKGKFDFFNVYPRDQLSILSGLIQPNGMAAYLKDTRKSAKSVKLTRMWWFQTVVKSYNIQNQPVQDLVNLDLLERIDATHAVTHITFGGGPILSIEDPNYKDQNEWNVKTDLENLVTKLSYCVNNELSLNLSNAERAQMNRLHYKLFIDTNLEPGSLLEAIKLFYEPYTSIENEASPIWYTILPIKVIKWLSHVNSTKDVIFKPIDELIVWNGVSLFDHLLSIEQKLNDFLEDLTPCEPYIKTDTFQPVLDLKTNLTRYETELRTNLAKHEILIRSGIESQDELENLISQAENDLDWWENQVTELSDSVLDNEIFLVRLLHKRNVTLISKGQCLGELLWKYFNNHLYVLFYDYSQTNWDEHVRQFLHIANEKEKNHESEKILASLNYDLDEGSMNQSKQTKISVFYRGKCIVDNLNSTTTYRTDLRKLYRFSIEK